MSNYIKSQELLDKIFGTNTAQINKESLIKLSKLAQETAGDNKSIAGAYIDDDTQKLTIMTFFWYTEFETTDTSNLVLAPSGLKRSSQVEKVWHEYNASCIKVTDLPKEFEQVNYVDILGKKFNRLHLQTILDCFDRESLTVYMRAYGELCVALYFIDGYGNKGFILPIMDNDNAKLKENPKGETLVDHLVRESDPKSFLKIKHVKRTGGFVYIKHNFDKENK